MPVKLLRQILTLLIVTAYIGVVYQGKFGQTANFARQAGESTGDVRFAFGVRVWF